MRHNRIRAVTSYAGVVVCLVLIMVGAARPTSWRWQMPTWHLPSWPVTDFPSLPSQPVPSGLPQTPPPANSGAVVGWVLLGVIAAAALVGLAWFLRRLIGQLRQTRIEPIPTVDALSAGLRAGPEAVAAAVIDGVELALARLDQAATAKDAVIAAWLALREAAARHGMEPSPAQTPTEFVMDLLSRSPAPRPAAEQLRTLYHQARFSTATTTGQARAAARDALAEIAGRLDTVTP